MVGPPLLRLPFRPDSFTSMVRAGTNGAKSCLRRITDGLKRLDLTPAVVKDALKLALTGSDGIVDLCDRLQPYLVLRVRGHVTSWLVKTRARTLKIGDAMPSATAARIRRSASAAAPSATNPWACGKPARRPSANGRRWAIRSKRRRRSRAGRGASSSRSTRRTSRGCARICPAGRSTRRPRPRATFGRSSDARRSRGARTCS